MNYTYSGAWHRMPENILVMADGTRFSHKSNTRPVVLAETLDPYGFNTVYPRSTRPRQPAQSRHPHKAHKHINQATSCAVDRDGWVILDAPISLLGTQFGISTFSCVEPQYTGLLTTLSQAMGI